MKRLLLLSLLLAVGLSGCNARKDFPQPSEGWHAPDYSVVFGRLETVSAGPDARPYVVVRFGGRGDAYDGELALTPDTGLVGYNGTETVEIRGHLLPTPTGDRYNGRWYVIDSIRLWSGYRQ